MARTLKEVIEVMELAAKTGGSSGIACGEVVGYLKTLRIMQPVLLVVSTLLMVIAAMIFAVLLSM